MSRSRTDHYRTRCHAGEWPDIIAHMGISKIGDVSYGDDGMLYKGRKSCGPYMVERRYCGTYFVVRFAERDNIHRFEALRWKLLLHLQGLKKARQSAASELRKIVKGESAYGYYANQWHELVFGCFEPLTLDRKPVQIKKEEVLDALAVLGRSSEEHKLVAAYLRLTDQLDKYWMTVRRFETAMLSIFRDLNPTGDHYHRTLMTFQINGRTYFDVRTEAPHHTADQCWPSPTMQHVDLDAARYVSGSSLSPSMTWLEAQHKVKTTRGRGRRRVKA